MSILYPYQRTPGYGFYGADPNSSQAEHLWAWWTAREGWGSSTVNDASGYGKPARMASGMTTDDYIVDDETRRQALDYGVRTQYKHLSAPGPYLANTDGITIVSWFRLDDVTSSGTYCHICSRGAVFANNTNISLSWRSRSDRRRFAYVARSGSTIVGSESDGGLITTTGQWHFLAAVWPRNNVGNDQIFYLNDGVFGAGAVYGDGFGTDGGQPWTIGAGTPQSGDDRGWSGLIEEVRIYNTVLTPGQVEHLRNNQYDLYYRPRVWFPVFPAGPPPGQVIVAETGAHSFTGQEANLLQGSSLIAESGAYTLTGQDVTFSQELVIVADTGVYLLDGLPVELSIAGNLVADRGEYTLTGQEALIPFHAVTGSYSLTGQEAEATRLFFLPADTGVYLLQGQRANLARFLVADRGFYELAGQEASLTTQAFLVTETGVYLLDGREAFLLTADAIAAERGSYGLTGQKTLFQRDAKQDAGEYNLDGQAVGLQLAKQFSTTEGLYSLMGRSVLFHRRLLASAGDYQLTGLPATGFAEGTLRAGCINLTGQQWRTVQLTGQPWRTVAIRSEVCE